MKHMMYIFQFFLFFTHLNNCDCCAKNKNNNNKAYHNDFKFMKNINTFTIRNNIVVIYCNIICHESIYFYKYMFFAFVFNFFVVLLYK
jgi:hypothetical protein